MGFIDKLKQFFAGLEEKSIKQTESIFGSDVRRLADYMDSAKGKAESRISSRLSSALESRLSSTLQFSAEPAPEKPTAAEKPTQTTAQKASTPEPQKPTAAEKPAQTTTQKAAAPEPQKPTAAEKPTQTTAQKASAPEPQKPATAPAPKKNRTLPEGYSVVKSIERPTKYINDSVFYLDDKITGYYIHTHFATYDSNDNKRYYEWFCRFVKGMGYDANSIVEQQSNAKRLPYSKRFDIVLAEIMKDFPGIAGIRNKDSLLGAAGYFILKIYDEIPLYQFENAVIDLHYMKKPFEYDKSQPLEQSVRELDAFIRSNGLLK